MKYYSTIFNTTFEIMITFMDCNVRRAPPAGWPIHKAVVVFAATIRVHTIRTVDSVVEVRRAKPPVISLAVIWIIFEYLYQTQESQCTMLLLTTSPFGYI